MTLAFVNERQQNRIQQRQEELGRGMMGPEARQISGQVLNDLGVVAQRSAALRNVLAKHGYEVARPPQNQQATAMTETNTPVPVVEVDAEGDQP